MSSGDATSSVAGAMSAHILAQEITARNLANVATPGFKRNVAVFEAASPGEEETTPTLSGVRVDFSPSALLPTGGALDFAIEGEGFFTVATEGGLRYTRNGQFRLDENRVLVTQDGSPVLGENGEMQIPDDAGLITVSRDGELRAGDAVIGRFQITAFERPELLQQTGHCEFMDAGSANPAPAAAYAVHQGFLESSNVQPVVELVRMIASLRDYEACARSLRSIEDSASKLYAWAGA